MRSGRDRCPAQPSVQQRALRGPMACRRRPLRWCACSSAQQPPAALATVTTARVVQELVRTHGRVKDDRILFAASRDGFSNHVFHENCGDGSHLFTHSRSGRSNHGPPPTPPPIQMASRRRSPLSCFTTAVSLAHTRRSHGHQSAVRCHTCAIRFLCSLLSAFQARTQTQQRFCSR